MMIGLQRPRLTQHSPGNGIFPRTYVVTQRRYDIVTPPTRIHGKIDVPVLSRSFDTAKTEFMITAILPLIIVSQTGNCTLPSLI